GTLVADCLFAERTKKAKGNQRPRLPFSIAGSGGRALQLDGVAVRILDVEGGPGAVGAVALADLARRDGVALEVRADRGLVEGGERERHVVDVAALRAGRRAAGPAERTVDGNQVDQALPGPELVEAERLDRALDGAAERVAPAAQRGLEVAHAQHDVVEPPDRDRVRGRVRLHGGSSAGGGASASGWTPRRRRSRAVRAIHSRS